VNDRAAIFDNLPVSLPRGSHPFPSRTRKLSLVGPMVLHAQVCGRLGDRRHYFREKPTLAVGFSALQPGSQGSSQFGDTKSYLPDLLRRHLQRCSRGCSLTLARAHPTEKAFHASSSPPHRVPHQQAVRDTLVSTRNEARGFRIHVFVELIESAGAWVRTRPFADAVLQ
jgi:hypothetical protein